MVNNNPKITDVGKLEGAKHLLLLVLKTVASTEDWQRTSTGEGHIVNRFRVKMGNEAAKEVDYWERAMGGK